MTDPEPPDDAAATEPGLPDRPRARTSRRWTVLRPGATSRWRVALWAGGGLAVGVVVTLLASLVVAAVTDADALERDTRPLVILSGRDESLGGQRQQLVTAWNTLHPDQPARIVELSPLADAQRAEMLARAQADDGAAGYVGQLADYEGRTVTALELIWGAGGEVVDDDGRVLPGDDDITAVHTGRRGLPLRRAAARRPRERPSPTDGGALRPVQRDVPAVGRRLPPRG